MSRTMHVNLHNRREINGVCCLGSVQIQERNKNSDEGLTHETLDFTTFFIFR